VTGTGAFLTILAAWEPRKSRPIGELLVPMTRISSLVQAMSVRASAQEDPRPTVMSMGSADE